MGVTFYKNPTGEDLTLDDLTLGSATDGGLLVVNSTLTELITSPMVTAGWTLGADTGAWAITAGVLAKTASTGTLTATAVAGQTAACVAGQKYRVTAVVSAASGSTTWTLGGTTIPSFSAAGTWTYDITAGTTAKLIFSGVAASTVTITSVSVQAIDTATGNATVMNDLTAGRVLARMGSAGTPSLSFANDPDTGMWGDGSNALYFGNGGTASLQITSARNVLLLTNTAYFALRSGDARLYSDATGTIDQRNSADQQAYRLYNFRTDASNHERQVFTGVAGASVNWTAETAGTGGDNLNCVVTPAGTGSLVSMTNLVNGGTPDVVSSAGAISVTTAISHIVTNGAGTVLTLAAGKEGQVKYIVLKTLTSGGQTDVITPDGGGAGFTTITMDALGDSVQLLYTNGKWTVVGSYSVTIA